MRKLHLSVLLLPFLLSISGHSQQAVITQAQFTAALDNVVSSEPAWRKTIEMVKVDDLPVAYTVGKQYEQSKYIVSKDLKMVELWAARAKKEHSFFTEVNLLSSVQELQSQMQQFAALLGDFDGNDVTSLKKVGAWRDALSDLANGPVENAWKASFNYTTNQAFLIDQSCSARVLNEPGATH